MKPWKRFRWFFRRRQFERDLAEEVRIHREMAAEFLGPDGAKRFGSVAIALEESLAVWGFGWLPSLAQDARYRLDTLSVVGLNTGTPQRCSRSWSSR